MYTSIVLVLALLCTGMTHDLDNRVSADNFLRPYFYVVGKGWACVYLVVVSLSLLAADDASFFAPSAAKIAPLRPRTHSPMREYRTSSAGLLYSCKWCACACMMCILHTNGAHTSYYPVSTRVYLKPKNCFCRSTTI